MMPCSCLLTLVVVLTLSQCGTSFLFNDVKKTALEDAVDKTALFVNNVPWYQYMNRASRFFQVTWPPEPGTFTWGPIQPPNEPVEPPRSTTEGTFSTKITTAQPVTTTKTTTTPQTTTTSTTTTTATTTTTSPTTTSTTPITTVTTIDPRCAEAKDMSLYCKMWLKRLSCERVNMQVNCERSCLDCPRIV